MNHLVFVRGVIEDHVKDDTNVSLLPLGDEVVHIGDGAVLWIDGLVVGDVVAEVNLGRGVHGRNPDSVDAQTFKVVQTLGDAVEIADAIAVGVLKAAGIDLVEDSVLPPGAAVMMRRWRRARAAASWQLSARLRRFHESAGGKDLLGWRGDAAKLEEMMRVGTA